MLFILSSPLCLPLVSQSLLLSELGDWWEWPDVMHLIFHSCGFYQFLPCTCFFNILIYHLVFQVIHLLLDFWHMFRNSFQFLVSLHVCFYILCLKNTLLEAVLYCFLLQLYQLQFYLLFKDTGTYNFLSRGCNIPKSPSLASCLSNVKIFPFDLFYF